MIIGTFLDHLIQFYLKNAINLRPLAPHIMSCYTRRMAALNRGDKRGQFHTIALFNGHGVQIHSTVQLRLLQASAENVLEAVERDLDDLAVHHREQVAQRGDAALVDEEADLVRGSARHRVGDRPRRLLARFELRPPHHVDQRRDYVGVDHSLQVDKPPTE